MDGSGSNGSRQRCQCLGRAAGIAGRPCSVGRRRGECHRYGLKQSDVSRPGLALPTDSHRCPLRVVGLSCAPVRRRCLGRVSRDPDGAAGRSYRAAKCGASDVLPCGGGRTRLGCCAVGAHGLGRGSLRLRFGGRSEVSRGFQHDCRTDVGRENKGVATDNGVASSAVGAGRQLRESLALHWTKRMQNPATSPSDGPMEELLDGVRYR